MGLWSGVILNSSLTYEGGLIPGRTKELTYIGGPGTKGLRCELSGRSERACRAGKAPHRDHQAEKEKLKRAGEGWKV